MAPSWLARAKSGNIAPGASVTALVPQPEASSATAASEEIHFMPPSYPSGLGMPHEGQLQLQQSEIAILPPMSKQEQYWRRNLRLLFGLLLIWGAVSFGCGILLHHLLDNYTLPGSHFPLGFWFAQQGSMMTFIVIVFFYAYRMNKLDHEFDVEEED